MEVSEVMGNSPHHFKNLDSRESDEDSLENTEESSDI